ncbi:type II toxin-antitoxin system RelE/ParE family toxin [Devosia sp.]|uniref:type II toxin-antitoxin system RelE/ParE family toxin n=1 Tax=Devosia sp. TaxID=1871048 RepID=UPI00343E4828
MRVVLSARASKAHAQIYRYISEQDPAAALRVGRRIVEATAALGRHLTGRPGRYRRSYEKSLPDIHYILVYRLERRSGEDIVLIVDIVHSRRDWPPGQLPPT